MQATQQATQRTHAAQPDKASMEIYVVIAFALVVIVGGVIFYNGSQSSSDDVVEVPVVKSQTPVIKVPEPVIIEQQPQVQPKVIEKKIEEPVEPKVIVQPQLPPLPKLDDSDKVVLEKTSQLSWLPNFATLLMPQDMLRNFVTFVDNLSRGDLVSKFAPLQRPKQKFSVRESEGQYYIDEASYKRYAPYVDIINSLNIELALEHYQRLMPLIDEAYMELGYEKGSFNHTLTKAIELMLAAPMIREPIELVAPSVMYKFKDPQLEQLPPAQKLMLRIGADNATQLRPKLQQIHITLSELNQ